MYKLRASHGGSDYERQSEDMGELRNTLNDLLAGVILRIWRFSSKTGNAIFARHVASNSVLGDAI